MNTLLNVERMIVQWLNRDFQRRALRTALRDAYASFAKQHPEWTVNFFDEHFVQSKLLPLLERAADEAVTVTPDQVAQLWVKQFSLLLTRQRQHLATVMPIAAHFLALLADEMAANSQPPALPVGPWLRQGTQQGTQGLLQQVN